MRRTLPLLASLMILALAAAQGAEPMSCDRANRGKLFPPAANTDSSVRDRAARCGVLKMCTAGVFRPRWESLSAPWWQLSGQSAPSECRAMFGPLSQRPGEGASVMSDVESTATNR